MKERHYLIQAWANHVFACQRNPRRLMVLLAVSLSLVCSPAYAQGTITLEASNQSIRNVFKMIEEKSDYVFLFNHDISTDIEKQVSINVKAASLEQVLNDIFKATDLVYKISGKQVLIGKKAPKPAAVQQPEMKVVSGAVADIEGPLEGVNVVLKGTSYFTMTDKDGKFSFRIPSDQPGVLVFSFLGMKTQEIRDAGKEFNVIMEIEEMGEVVITGIFKRKKEGFTGSVTQLSSADIQKLSSNNVLKALEIVDPAFKVSGNNLSGSNPNAIPDFQLRGQASIGDYESDDFVVMRGDFNTRPNQPLFVLDGIIGVSAATVMNLDPERVESITLLKDAAATVIYGSQAANGVVVIETKAPVSGKLRFTYNGNYRFETPDLSVYNLLNAGEKLQIEELAGYYNDKNNLGLQNYYNTIQQEILSGVNTYWIAQPVQNSFNHRHGLTIEGGDNALRYKIYMGANFAPGVMKGTNLDTKSGQVDIIYRVNKFLISNQIYVDYSSGARVSPYGSFQEYTLINPYYRMTDANGNYKPVLDDHKTGTGSSPDEYVGFYTNPTMNPLYNTLFASKNEARTFDFQEALKVEYLPLDNLRLSLDFSLGRNDGTVEIFKSAQNTEFYLINEPSLRGRFQWQKSEGFTYRLSFTGSYNKNFGENHQFSAFARYSIYENSTRQTQLTKTGFPNDKLSEVYMGSTYESAEGAEGTTRALGFMFTLNYFFKQRYAIDYSMRIDASSEFGRNNRYAPFWSAGLRWNVDKEKFIKNLKVFDEFIIRGTYGITGSQGFSPYQSLQMYTYENLMKKYKSSPTVGAEVYGLGNTELKWQQTDNYNVSMDFSMFKNIIGIKVEYYQKYTKNTLLDYSLAPSVGFSSMKENLGKISNKGVEMILRLMPYSNSSKRAYWNIVLTGASNKSRIEEISNALKYRNETQMKNVTDRPLPRYENGYSQSVIWAVRSAGIDPMTGREVFVQRDGQLTNEYRPIDQVPVGDREPDFSGSISTSFNYKGFSLSISGMYKWGGQKFNSTLIDKVENANLRLNVDKRALTERWKQPGDQALFKAINGDITREPTKATSRFVMDDNEFVLSTINLAYRMDKQHNEFLKWAGIEMASIGLYFEDIATFSSIRMERGIDYPFARQISMSLNLTF